MATNREYTTERFGASVAVTAGVWYGEPRVEILSVSAVGPRGGAPKTVQVLLDLDQARSICDKIDAAITAAATEKAGADL